MMRIFFALTLLVHVLPAHANEIWSNLWHNADQQGEILLQHGDANSAAKVFVDPRRKAFAKMKAGDYSGAAQDLSNLHDSDADYNRGNALAHTGNLQGAFEAYNNALKNDPNNQDAKHNRDLVEKALKQQSQQPKNNNKNQSKYDTREHQHGNGRDSSGQDKKGDQTGTDKNGQQGNTGSADNNSGKNSESSAQNKPQQQSGEVNKSKDGNSSDDKGTRPNGSSQGKQNNKAGQETNKKGEMNNAGQAAPAGEKSDIEQARQDAAAALEKPTIDGKNGEGIGGESVGSKTIPTATPKSEQQIAQEQWLRSIPDDPSGLLRRKFMIEHLIRQQKAQQ